MYSIYGPEATVLDGNFPANSKRVIQMYGGTVVLSGFTIRNASNGVDTAAAGIHMEGCILENCLIYSNYCKSGGNPSGVGIQGGTMRNCTLVMNRGGNGAFYYSANDVKVQNCIIMSNYTHAGVLANWSISTVQGGLTITNTCTYPAIPTNGSGNVTNDPMFVDPNSGNWRLKTTSPCVNTGLNQSWMTNSYDLDGRRRILYGTVDMGCYETIYDGSIYSVH